MSNPEKYKTLSSPKYGKYNYAFVGWDMAFQKAKYIYDLSNEVCKELEEHSDRLYTLIGYIDGVNFGPTNETARFTQEERACLDTIDAGKEALSAITPRYNDWRDNYPNSKPTTNEN